MLKVAKADLRRSGITVQEAEEAEMYSIQDASGIYGDFREHPALVIPYVDPWTNDYITFERDGETVPFCRVRYFPPEKKVQIFGKKKLLRYTQPADSGVHPYFPMVDGLDWLDVADDAATPIMITEGEKKSLAACLATIPTIGLGGVYNFFSNGALLPILDKIKWEGRPVYICYDSDASNNNNIQAAEARLATELSQKRKAHVFLVRLPDSPSGAKVGVDDYLVDHGDDALFDLLEGARDMRPMDKEILRMNEEVAWIEAEGLVLDLEHDIWMKKTDFTMGSVYSARKILTPKAKGSGVNVNRVAMEWLTSPLARRYKDIKFAPGSDQRELKLPNGMLALNLFRGLEGEKGDVGPFFELMDWLLSRTDEFDPALVWKTICYKIQNLDARIDLGIMLLGTEGSGKSMFSKIVANMVTPHAKVMNSKGLGSDYNGWLETSLIIAMDEAKGYELKKNMSTLKSLITERRQPMNEKYRKARDVDNHGFFVFTSNERSAGAFSDDDRRMIVIGCPGVHPEGEAFYQRVGAWMDAGGSRKLLHYFQEYDLEGWEPPYRAPTTREKRMAFLSNLTPIQQLAYTVKGADKNIVLSWISASLEWAHNTPDDSALAAEVAQTLPHIPIRPFYTPEELALLFPHISATLRNAKVPGITSANLLAQEFLQAGIDYLRCDENMDGFVHKGLIRQYFIVSDHEKFRAPISQEDFEDLVEDYPTYKELRDATVSKEKQTRRKRKRES